MQGNDVILQNGNTMSFTICEKRTIRYSHTHTNLFMYVFMHDAAENDEGTYDVFSE